MTGTFAVETRAQLVRWLWHLRREPFNLYFSLIQPAFWLLLFSSLFARTAGSSFGGDYTTFLTGGVVVMTVFGNSLTGGISLLFDREAGILDRVLASPISRSSIVVARFLYVLLVSFLQTGIILAIAFAMGVRVETGLPGVAVILVFAALLGVGVTVVSLCLAFVFHNHGEFFAIVGFLSLPLIFLSTALVPIDRMPGWMARCAYLNPMTYAIDAVRSLILTGWDAAYLLSRAGALILFDALVFAFCVRVLRRRLS